MNSFFFFSLNVSHLYFSMSLLIKIYIIRFSVVIQLLSLILREAISLSFTGSLIRVDSFLEFLGLFAGIRVNPIKQ